jgi:hypothetical protein
MDLYQVDLEGSIYSCDYSNRYKVVADTIPEAIEKAIKKMKENKVNEVKILKVELIESGIII